MSRPDLNSSWSHNVWVIYVIDSVSMLPNCSGDDIPRQKRRKVSISPSNPYVGDKEDVSMLPAENWRTEQEAVVPMDGGGMIDFDYNIGDL